MEQQAPPTGKNMPVVVTNIVWCRQLESKASDTLSVAEALLGGLSGFKVFQQEASEVRDVLREYQKFEFDNWCTELTDAISQTSQAIW